MFLNQFIKKLKTRTLPKKSAITFIDQFVLSGVNFVIGLIFIYFSTPEEYGRFAFYMSLFYLFASVQNAIINTPMLVLCPRMDEKEALDFRKGMFVLLCPFFGMIIFITYIISFFESNSSTSWSIILISFGMSLLLTREHFRTEEYAELHPIRALKRDVFYSALSLLGISILIYIDKVNINTVFFILGFATIVVVFGKAQLYLKTLPSINLIRNSFKKSWTYSKWSIVGASCSWVNSNAYIFISYFLLGADAVALLAASRLVMTPIMLMTMSWGNLTRPLMSSILSGGETTKAHRIILFGTILQIIVLFSYILVIISLFSFLPLSWVPSDYQNIDMFLLFWFGICLLNIIRSNLSYFIQASLNFKELAISGVWIATITVILTISFIYLWGTYAALLSMIISELIFIILLCKLFYKIKNSTFAP